MKNTQSYDDLLIKIAKNIQRVRLKKKLTQDDMASYHGFNYRHYQKIESGTYSPNLRTLHRLAEALEVDVKDFFK